MYFNVQNLSNITNYAGDAVLPKFLNKKFVKTYSSHSRIRWPIQEHPGLRAYNIWCNFIQGISGCNTNSSKKVKLGEWSVHPMSVQKVSTWINDSHTHIIIYNPDGYWYQHDLILVQHTKKFITHATQL
jgi:hypothetical protein